MHEWSLKYVAHFTPKPLNNISISGLIRSDSTLIAAADWEYWVLRVFVTQDLCGAQYQDIQPSISQHVLGLIDYNSSSNYDI